MEKILLHIHETQIKNRFFNFKKKLRMRKVSTQNFINPTMTIIEL